MSFLIALTCALGVAAGPLSTSTSPVNRAAGLTTLAPVPASPSRPNSRPTTPARDELSAPISEMDVSNVDPEEVLLDYQTIEPGDVSAEIDPAEVNTSEDKVMVSVRCVIRSLHSYFL